MPWKKVGVCVLCLCCKREWHLAKMERPEEDNCPYCGWPLTVLVGRAWEDW